jgi:hypothetical protein
VNHPDLDKAIKAYNQKDYVLALPLLNSYLRTDSSDTELVLARNSSLIENGIYNDAIVSLDNIINSKPAFRSQALWYKALAYLKQDNKVLCKETLLLIPEDAQEYSKARKLLAKL